MRLFALGCVLAGCGRLGFDAPRIGGGADAAALDAAADDAQVLPQCPLSLPVPGSINVTGQTFAYTAVNNQTTPVASTFISASINGMQVATTQSDMAGNYSLSIPTNSMPVKPEIDYSPSGYWVTQILPQRALTADVIGPNMTRWQLGDGPVWADGQMGSVYSAAGLSYDLAKGTLEIAARDCTENPVEGVVFDVTPAPQKLLYIDASGATSATQTSTIAPYTHAVGFNAVPGPTHITATKNGVIYSVDVDVPAGRFNTYPVFYFP